MSAAPPADRLRSQLLRRIEQTPHVEISDAEFDELALQIFRYQYAANAPYRAFCDRRGADPAALRDWTEIPAVPTSAFKAVALVCGEPGDAQAVFRTSGTTGGRERRGRHFLPDLALYDAALRAGFAAHLLPDRVRLPILSLIPPPSELPDSSLSHMIGELVEEPGAEGSAFFADAETLDVGAMILSLQTWERSRRAVCVVATSFALLHLLDTMRERKQRCGLAAGSRLMDTGGFKGRRRQVSRAELYAEVELRLGIPTAWCVNEYGMTELSSQFYDTVAGEARALSKRRYRGPSWVRTRAVNPETLELLEPGASGILRHWDLANLGSVLAVQTEDLGAYEGGTFQLFGRAEHAEPRGCSLATEELLAAVRNRSA